MSFKNFEWEIEFLLKENKTSAKEWAYCDINCETFHNRDVTGGDYCASGITLL